MGPTWLRFVLMSDWRSSGRHGCRWGSSRGRSSCERGSGGHWGHSMPRSLITTLTLRKKRECFVGWTGSPNGINKVVNRSTQFKGSVKNVFHFPFAIWIHARNRTGRSRSSVLNEFPSFSNLVISELVLKCAICSCCCQTSLPSPDLVLLNYVCQLYCIVYSWQNVASPIRFRYRPTSLFDNKQTNLEWDDPDGFECQGCSNWVICSR